MIGNPLVSVIINCYNGEKYLREAIDSVMAQTYDNWEMVFWDNQSTDGTREIVESYHSPKIHYYYAPEHTPLGEARNLAVEKANGEYINFLDADDVWMPEKLEKQVALIVPGEVEVVYTGFKVIFEGQHGNEELKDYYDRLNRYKPNPKRTIYQNLLFRNIAIFSSVMLNARLFEEVGGINPILQQNEDYELLLKCALKTDFGRVDGEMVNYRIHAGNNSTKNDSLYIEENRAIYAALPKSSDLERAKKELEVRYCFSLIRGRMYGAAVKHFIKCGDIIALLTLIYRRVTNN